MTWIDLNGKCLNLDFIRKIEVDEEIGTGMYRVLAWEQRYVLAPGPADHELFRHWSEAVAQRAYEKILKQMDVIDIARLLADGDA